MFTTQCYLAQTCLPRKYTIKDKIISIIYSLFHREVDYCSYWDRTPTCERGQKQKRLWTMNVEFFETTPQDSVFLVFRINNITGLQVRTAHASKQAGYWFNTCVVLIESREFNLLKLHFTFQHHWQFLCGHLYRCFTGLSHHAVWSPLWPTADTRNY